MSLTLESLEAAIYEPLLHKPFILHFSTRDKITLVLTEVKRLGYRRAGATRDPFALTFDDKKGTNLPQGIYAVEHEVTGSLEIFLTQLGAGENGSQFEAVFT